MSYLYKGKDGKTPRKRTEHAAELFDYLADEPDGVNLHQIRTKFGWGSDTAKEALRALRIILGEDTINVVSEPTAYRKQWTIRLVGNYEDSRWYQGNRIGDMEARLETCLAWARSYENAEDGRTVNGKKAALMRSTVSHLLEQLQLLDSWS